MKTLRDAKVGDTVTVVKLHEMCIRDRLRVWRVSAGGSPG